MNRHLYAIFFPDLKNILKRNFPKKTPPTTQGQAMATMDIAPLRSMDEFLLKESR